MPEPTPILSIINVSIEELKPYKFNPREHPPKQQAMLVKSIKKFGFNAPVLIGQDFELIAGHGRVEAARRCNLLIVPAVVLPHLNEAERRAYRIADNNIALKAKWSVELLRREVEFLLDDDFEFDSEEVGFETGEVDFVLSGNRVSDKPLTISPPRRDRPAVSKRDDVWTCAGHRLVCGDSTERATYEHLMAGERARAVITDMPWNRRVNGEIGGLGKIHHPEFAMASGEMSRPEFSAFMVRSFEHQAEFSLDGAICLNFIDWRSAGDMITAGEAVFTGGLINMCVWVKQTGGMGSLWRSRQELVCAFKAGKAPHINNVMLGKWGRNRTNVWEYPAPLG